MSQKALHTQNFHSRSHPFLAHNKPVLSLLLLISKSTLHWLFCDNIAGPCDNFSAGLLSSFVLRESWRILWGRGFSSIILSPWSSPAVLPHGQLWLCTLTVAFWGIQHLVTSPGMASSSTLYIEILVCSAGVTSRQNTWSPLGHGCPSPSSSGIQHWWEIEASSRPVASLFCLSPRGSGCSLYLPFLQSLKFCLLVAFPYFI